MVLKRQLHGYLHRTRPFEAPGLPGRYPLTIWLPPGYERHGTKRYPVAYMFDGQNLFGDEGSFSGGWHLHEALDARASRGKLVPIVVGIHHGGASRMEELAPWPIQRGVKPRGDATLDWIVGPLAKMVAEDLRVLPGPENTMLGGSSLGGLMALYGLVRYPLFFGNILAMSPSIWTRRGAMLTLVQHAHLWQNSHVYLDCGKREGQTFELCRALAGILDAKGVSEGDQLMWRPDLRGSHNERNWRRRLPKALKFLYG